MNTSIRILNNYVKANLVDEADLIWRLLIKLSPVEMYVQMQSANYLDLAFPSPVHVHWKKHINNAISRRLPHFCGEFYIAEKVPDEKFLLWLYDHLVSYLEESLDKFYDSLQEFTKTITLTYETKMFHNISDEDSVIKCWKIRKYLRFYRIVNVDRFEVTFPYLLDLCMNPPLNCELTVDLLKSFCKTEHQMLMVMKVVEDTRMMENVILHAKNARFDFWGLWKGSTPIPSLNFVSHFLANWNFDQERLKILLKYGFTYSGHAGECRERFNILRRRVNSGRAMFRSYRTFHCDNHQLQRMMLIMDIFLIFANEENSYMIPTLKYLFRSLPLHYVTPKELHDTMGKAVAPHHHRELEDIVAKYSESVLDDDFLVPSPRLLMHLCRVAVRMSLVDNFQLLDGIKELPIPETLKTYLELES